MGGRGLATCMYIYEELEYLRVIGLYMMCCSVFRCDDRLVGSGRLSGLLICRGGYRGELSSIALHI